MTGTDRNIVIHLGFPKTGTTTIQSLLDANTARLEPELTIAAKGDLTLQLRKVAMRAMHVPMARAFWMWRFHRGLKQLRRDVDAMTFKTLIISDETLFGLNPARLSDISTAGTYEDMLRALDAALDGYAPRYIVYLRDPESWKTSFYNQNFKRRRTTQSFADWSKEHDFETGPLKVIERMRVVLGDRLAVRQMEDDRAEGRFLGQALLEYAGLPPERFADLEMPPRQNESMSPAAIELLRMIHENPAFRGKRYRFLVRLFARNPELFAELPKPGNKDDT